MIEPAPRSASPIARLGQQPIAIAAAALVKGLEATQQESIDQLQMVQDQLQTVRRLLAAQQADSKKLSEQVGTLTEAVEGLRQSFASAQSSEPSAAPAARMKSPHRSASAASENATVIV